VQAEQNEHATATVNAVSGHEGKQDAEQRAHHGWTLMNSARRGRLDSARERVPDEVASAVTPRARYTLPRSPMGSYGAMAFTIQRGQRLHGGEALRERHAVRAGGGVATQRRGRSANSRHRRGAREHQEKSPRQWGRHRHDQGPREPIEDASVARNDGEQRPAELPAG